ncbi:MAG: beta-mannosidase [Ruminococcus sp.]|nr:beta-mannosidase [Ruminococcus sp.]
MRKNSLAFFMAATMLPCSLPVCAAEADTVIYEAENAVMTGSMETITDLTASGGQAAGKFADDGDTLTFTITVPNDGTYDFAFMSKGIGSDKTNNVLIDGEYAGTFDSADGTYSEFVLHGNLLSAGDHSVTVTKSWGWIRLDYLKVTPAESISDEVYYVENTLINPAATRNTKALYSYLCEAYGNVTLAGQVCDNGLNGEEFSAIHEVTGKYPAMLGLDMMDYCPSRAARGARTQAVERAIEFHEAGGIVTFCWHWNAPDQYLLPDAEGENPRWWGGFYSQNSSFDLAAVMNGSDAEGKTLLDADIAEIAKQLHRLENAGVPVLWRPLHEASGGWFWWGSAGKDAYKELWIYLYDQLTNTYQCNNLIWVWNGQAADWYPGDAYVDIIGEDIYADAHQYGAHTAKFTELLTYSQTNKIIALTENGVVFDIDKMIATNAKWAWFNTWCGSFVTENGTYSESHTSKEILSKAYASEYVITLDELPDLYNSNMRRGDVNADGNFSLADVVMLQKWIIKRGNITDWQAGDLDDNQQLTAADLTEMKKMLLGQ